MSSAAGGSSGFLRRNARALAASVALLIGLVWVLRAGALPLVPGRGALDHIDWSAILLAALALLVSIWVRLVRVYFLTAPIAPVSLRRIVTISCISLGLLTFLPFRLGEMARPAMLREKGKLSGWAVTATVGAERIIDGVLFSLSLLLGLAFAQPHEPLPDHIGDLPVPAALVPRAAQIASLGFGLAFVVMVAFFLWREPARRLTRSVLGLVSRGLAERVADTIDRLSDGLRFLPDLRHTGPFLGFTLLGLLLHVWSLQIFAYAVGLPEVGFAESVVLLGVLGLGFALPNAPGFFGAVQLALYAGLAVYVSPEKVVHEGSALVFLFYVIYLALVVLITLAGLGAEYGLPAQQSAVTEKQTRLEQEAETDPSRRPSRPSLTVNKDQYRPGE